MLLAPRRDTAEANRSVSSGLREEAQETDDEMGCGPQKLRATKILGHVALLRFDQTSGSCSIRACRNSSKQVPRMDNESGVLGSV